jgi:predicted  nucleic acid-binding Zn-ribbon protein
LGNLIVSVAGPSEGRQGLQQLYSELEKRNNRDMQCTQQEIEKLNAAVAQSKQRESDQLDEAKEQISKLQKTQPANIAIEQEFRSVREPINQIKNDNADMRTERPRLDTAIYSSRISKHRTHLH